MNGLAIEIPREGIEAIAREVAMQCLAEARLAVMDNEAQEIAITLQRINAKQFISIPEFGFLFNCSPGYIGKLIEKAQKKTTAYPVPFLNLDGLVQFDRVAVLAWAAEAKPMEKRQRKTGPKRVPIRKAS